MKVYWWQRNKTSHILNLRTKVAVSDEYDIATVVPWDKNPWYRSERKLFWSQSCYGHGSRESSYNITIRSRTLANQSTDWRFRGASCLHHHSFCQEEASKTTEILCRKDLSFGRDIREYKPIRWVGPNAMKLTETITLLLLVHETVFRYPAWIPQLSWRRRFRVFLRHYRKMLEKYFKIVYGSFLPYILQFLRHNRFTIRYVPPDLYPVSQNLTWRKITDAFQVHDAGTKCESVFSELIFFLAKKPINKSVPLLPSVSSLSFTLVYPELLIPYLYYRSIFL